MPATDWKSINQWSIVAVSLFVSCFIVYRALFFPLFMCWSRVHPSLNNSLSWFYHVLFTSIILCWSFVHLFLLTCLCHHLSFLSFFHALHVSCFYNKDISFLANLRLPLQKNIYSKHGHKIKCRKQFTSQSYRNAARKPAHIDCL